MVHGYVKGVRGRKVVVVTGGGGGGGARRGDGDVGGELPIYMAIRNMPHIPMEVMARKGANKEATRYGSAPKLTKLSSSTSQRVMFSLHRKASSDEKAKDRTCAISTPSSNANCRSVSCCRWLMTYMLSMRMVLNRREKRV